MAVAHPKAAGEVTAETFVFLILVAMSALSFAVMVVTP